MKKTAFAISMMFLAVVLIGALPTTVQAGDEGQLEAYYNEYISHSIVKNQSKANLQTSRSANLRLSGNQCAQKVDFLTNHRSMLVNEMIENDIGTKPYKIDYYLNKRFHEMKRLVSTDVSSPANQ
jgi:hypothetical protein